MEYYLIYSEDYLAHYGVEGMKWGRRQYQYQDGSYTPAGKARYGIGDGKSYNGTHKSGQAPKIGKYMAAPMIKMSRKTYEKQSKKQAKSFKNGQELSEKKHSSVKKELGKTALKTIANTAAVEVGTRALTYTLLKKGYNEKTIENIDTAIYAGRNAVNALMTIKGISNASDISFYNSVKKGKIKPVNLNITN